MNPIYMRDFLDWLWNRLNQEPNIQKALDGMTFIHRRQLEIEVRDKLNNDTGR
jgi:hypothetical protein